MPAGLWDECALLSSSGAVVQIILARGIYGEGVKLASPAAVFFFKGIMISFWGIGKKEIAR